MGGQEREGPRRVLEGGGQGKGGEGGGPVWAQGDMSGRPRGIPHREMLTLAFSPIL